MSHVKNMEIRGQVKGSDHAPIVLTMDYDKQVYVKGDKSASSSVAKKKRKATPSKSKKGSIESFFKKQKKSSKWRKEGGEM